MATRVERESRSRIRVGDGDPRHGTTNGYSNLLCRCVACKEAHREYMAVSRAQRVARGLEPNDPRHGSYNAYSNYGCRCDKCREADRLHWSLQPDRVAAREERAARKAEQAEMKVDREYRKEAILQARAAFEREMIAARVEFDRRYYAAYALYVQTVGEQPPYRFFPIAPDDPRHGTITAYTGYGCRCDACRRSMAKYQLSRRARERAAKVHNQGSSPEGSQ